MNDKFLDICFKLGKLIFSILLLIALTISLFFWVKTGMSCSKASKINVKYEYDIENIVREKYSKDLGLKNPEKEPPKESKSKTINKNLEQAVSEFNKYIDDNKLPAIYKLNSNNMGEISDKEKTLFAKKMLEFHKNYNKEFIEVLKQTGKFSEKDIEYIIKNNTSNLYNDAATEFYNAADIEYKNVEAQKQKVDQEKQAYMLAALISLGIFILFLFLPILIRIEENTRK